MDFRPQFVDDVEALYNEYRLSGATFAQHVQDKPWGLREFEILTPEGHRLRSEY